MNSDIKQYAQDHSDELLYLLISLCKIPAPSHFEHERARFCEKWFKENCTDDVYIDKAQNVICSYGDKNAEKSIVFMAHTDTVFPNRDPMPIEEKDGKLYCPGIGDDTANLAILMLMAKYIFQTRPKTEYQILFVANSCEEGLGNLKGCIELMRVHSKSVEMLISFDLDTNTLINRAVGSHRYLIKTKTAGGHSYFDFGRENAIHTASKVISELYSQEIPKEFANNITLNVGTVSGGTSVNTIAPSCEFTYEYRSDLNACLEIMKGNLDDIIKKYQDNGHDVCIECIGKRPGMSALRSPEDAEALVALAEKVYQQVLGKTPARAAGSTDCNIPLSMGITSLCIGLVEMNGAHTKDEYVVIESLPIGLELAITFSLSVINKDFNKFEQIT